MKKLLFHFDNYKIWVRERFGRRSLFFLHLSMLFNLHTHTNFCDGSDHPAEYIKAAIENGFKVLGFSSHGPMPFDNYFSIQNDVKLQAYCSSILKLKEKNKDLIEIYLALELDYIPETTYPFLKIKTDFNLDYVIGAIHFIKYLDYMWFIDGPDNGRYAQGLKEYFNNDIKKAITKYYSQINEMITNEKPDIIAHFDKIKMHNRDRFFNETDKWYIDLVYETMELLQKNDTIVEINTRGVYRKRSNSFFPGEWIIRLLKKKGIRITISSDAHKTEDLPLLLNEARELAIQCGYREIFAYSKDGFIPVEI